MNKEKNYTLNIIDYLDYVLLKKYSLRPTEDDLLFFLVCLNQENTLLRNTFLSLQKKTLISDEIVTTADSSRTSEG